MGAEWECGVEALWRSGRRVHRRPRRAKVPGIQSPKSSKSMSKHVAAVVALSATSIRKFQVLSPLQVPAHLHPHAPAARYTCFLLDCSPHPRRACTVRAHLGLRLQANLLALNLSRRGGGSIVSYTLPISLSVIWLSAALAAAAAAAAVLVFYSSPSWLHQPS